jgi:hypothetical protein
MADSSPSLPHQQAYPVLCAGCRHFCPNGGAILSAEPACNAPVGSATSQFQTYFSSRRRLVRARSASTCDWRIERDASS